MSNNIKEIKITYFDNCLYEAKFKEVLKISSKWISYKKTYGDSEKSWDYKDSCFEKIYDDICSIVSKLNYFDNVNDEVVIKTVDYNNNESTYKIRKSCIDYCNEIEKDFLSKIIDMIPNDLIMPKCLFASTPHDVDLVALEEIINYVESLIEKEKRGEEVFYSGGIVDSIMGLIEPDYCYFDHLDVEVKDQKEEDLSYAELRTLITKMSREIHFDAADVKYFIDNGKLLKWLKAIIQLAR